MEMPATLEPVVNRVAAIGHPKILADVPKCFADEPPDPPLGTIVFFTGG